MLSVGSTSGEEEGVGDMPQLSPCRRHDTAEEGKIVEAARESSHSALRASQDGSVHADGSVVTGGIVEDDDIGDFGSKSPQASVPLGSDKAIEGPPKRFNWCVEESQGFGGRF